MDNIINMIQKALNEKYEEGYADAEKEHGLTWHCFPDEKPDSHKPILFAHTSPMFFRNEVTMGEYRQGDEQFMNYRFMNFVPEDMVTAWAEVPRHD